jgi:hypothetical protein
MTRNDDALPYYPPCAGANAPPAPSVAHNTYFVNSELDPTKAVKPWNRHDSELCGDSGVLLLNLNAEPLFNLELRGVRRVAMEAVLVAEDARMMGVESKTENCTSPAHYLYMLAA